MERAIAAFNRGDWPDAEKSCRSVLAAHADYLDALHLLGAVAVQTGRPLEAAELLARAAAIKPADVEIHNTQSLIVTMSFARKLLSAAPQADGLRLFGPADAPVAMVRGRHRVRLLVQSPREFDLSGYVRFWLTEGPRTKGNLRVQVDIDPMSFY